MKILVLTTHVNRSPSNAVYRLLHALANEPRCRRLDVLDASIGSRDDESHPVFLPDSLRVRTLDPTFGVRDGWGSEKSHLARLGDYGAVYVRADRPVSDGSLDEWEQALGCALVVNRPAAIAAADSKEFLLNFRGLCPPMDVCRTVDEVLEFEAVHPTVLKPLRGHDSEGVMLLNGAHGWVEARNVGRSAVIEKVEASVARGDGYLATRFMQYVRQGAKRVLVVNGTALCASLRIPAKECWLASARSGAVQVDCAPDPVELHIAAKIWPRLEAAGVAVFDFGTVVGDNKMRVLSDINTIDVRGFEMPSFIDGGPAADSAARLILDYITTRQAQRR